MADLRAVSSFEDEANQPPGTFKLIRGDILCVLLKICALKVDWLQTMKPTSMVSQSSFLIQLHLLILMSHW